MITHGTRERSQEQVVTWRPRQAKWPPPRSQVSHRTKLSSSGFPHTVHGRLACGCRSSFPSQFASLGTAQIRTGSSCESAHTSSSWTSLTAASATSSCFQESSKGRVSVSLEHTLHNRRQATQYRHGYSQQKQPSPARRAESTAKRQTSAPGLRTPFAPSLFSM